MLRFIVILLFLSLFSINASALKGTESNINLLLHFYSDIFEKNKIDHLPLYVSKNVVFYNNSEPPIGYNKLQEHLEGLIKKYSTCKVLPMDLLFTKENKVVSLYTQNCSSREDNHIDQTRLMVITEFSSSRKISKIWVVSHKN